MNPPEARTGPSFSGDDRLVELISLTTSGWYPIAFLRPGRGRLVRFPGRSRGGPRHEFGTVDYAVADPSRASRWTSPIIATPVTTSLLDISSTPGVLRGRAGPRLARASCLAGNVLRFCSGYDLGEVPLRHRSPGWVDLGHTVWPTLRTIEAGYHGSWNCPKPTSPRSTRALPSPAAATPCRLLWRHLRRASDQLGTAAVKMGRPEPACRCGGRPADEGRPATCCSPVVIVDCIDGGVDRLVDRRWPPYDLAATAISWPLRCGSGADAGPTAEQGGAEHTSRGSCASAPCPVPTGTATALRRLGSARSPGSSRSLLSPGSPPPGSPPRTAPVNGATSTDRPPCRVMTPDPAVVAGNGP